MRDNLKYDTVGELQAAKRRAKQAELDEAYRRDNYLFFALLISVLLLLVLVMEWVGK